jgi:ankyrin repeat protein
MIQALVDAGADVNARSRYGETALFNSVSDLTTLRLLLNHGAKINARNWKGETPLMEATHRVTPESLENKIAALRLLLSYGAAVDLKDRDGETGLSRVMDEKPTPEILRIIVLLKQAGAKELPANRRRIKHHCSDATIFNARTGNPRRLENSLSD